MTTKKKENTNQEMLSLFHEWSKSEDANFSLMTWKRLNEISAKYKDELAFTEQYICKTFLRKSNEEQQELFFEFEFELHAGVILDFRKVVSEESEFSIEKTMDMLRYLLDKLIEE